LKFFSVAEFGDAVHLNEQRPRGFTINFLQTPKQINKEGDTMLKKFFLFSAMALLFIFIFNGCEKKPEVTEAPATEEITVALTPSDQEMRGELFTLKLSDLKIIKTVNRSTKELTATPSLRGSIKISNNSTNILDIKEISIQYLDSLGNPIPFTNGGKKAKGPGYWREIHPGEDSEKSLDVKVPIAAVKEKSINKIRCNVVYTPTPLKKETMDAPVGM